VHRYRRATLCLTSLAVALAGCGGHYPQTTLAPRSDLGLSIDHLFTGIFGWALAVFIVVEGLLLFTIIKFRARPGAPEPKTIHGHTALEIAWTLAPVLILVVVAVPTVRTIFQTQAPAPAGALQVQVIGHQWWWEYRYPAQAVVTANELHVPVGRPIQLVMTSADVIHSFWAPAVAAKRDVIPGHTNYIVFTPDSVGTYTGQCAEFCGDSHANMRLSVMVESDSAFRAWVADQQAPAAVPDPKSLAGQGKAVFSRSACIGCHTITGVSAGVIGPNLSHVASRTTIAGGEFPNDSLDLALWIHNAPDRKPGSMMMRMDLTPADLEAVVAYLRSLK
jgi:cytochrome c oxidase subunit 2